MSEMKIDLRVIRHWVQRWRANDRTSKTASQLAAVMLSEVLQDSEGRLSRTESVMSDLLAESRALERVEQQLVTRLKSKRGLDVEMQEQLRAHRRRMAVLLKEADKVLKEPREDRSVKIGGLVFEISRPASGVKAAPGDPVVAQA